MSTILKNEYWNLLKNYIRYKNIKINMKINKLEKIELIPIKLPDKIYPGDDLVSMIYGGLIIQNLKLQDGDIFVVTQKIVSKAEGKVIKLKSVIPSRKAIKLSKGSIKSPEYIEIVIKESKSILKEEQGILVSETKHGFVCVNAGVDESNVDGKGTVSLLPNDPDSSAEKIRNKLMNIEGTGKVTKLAVIISDTWERPWRSGLVNFAIGISGMNPIYDYRGQNDTYGRKLVGSEIAVADEIASASELVMGKTRKIPVVLVRGYDFIPGEFGINSLIRFRETDSSK
jgi:coenzyme F420-0:L-glutamate ligase / coenzyme F420-1:gamma-L-glutamate ligase